MSQLGKLPLEIFLKIVNFLNNASIESLELADDVLGQIIRESVQIWRHKINQFCKSHSQYKNVLRNSEYRGITKSAADLRRFYQSLLNINNNICNGKFAKIILPCLEVEVKGRRVVVNSDWDLHHTYKGVYDMIFDNDRICASVYDSIQIWDTQDYRLTHLLSRDVLDQDKNLVTCFTLTQNYLICGAENGYIKVLDIDSEKILSRARINSNYIADIKFKNGKLFSLDWFGNIYQWKLSAGGALASVGAREGSYQVPQILQNRDIERLLDFTDDFIITTFKCHISIYRNAEFVLSVPVYSDVFCIQIQEDLLAFGCKGESRNPSNEATVNPVAGVLNLSKNLSFGLPRIVYLRTRDNDAVISIHLSAKYLILGDVNGEIHIVDVEDLQFPERTEVFIQLLPDKALTESNGKGKVILEKAEANAAGEKEEKVAAEGGEIRGAIGTTSAKAPGEDLTYGCRLVNLLRSHEYRDFIWAIKSDGYRIFSGDETGRIIVHDFLAFNQPLCKITTEHSSNQSQDMKKHSPNHSVDASEFSLN